MQISRLGFAPHKVKTLARRLRRDQRGAAVPFFVISFPVLIGVAAAAEVAHIHYMRAKLQTTADAAALAGVAFLQDSFRSARTEAKRIAWANMPRRDFGNVMPNRNVVQGHWDEDTKTFAVGGTPANAIRTTAERSVANNNAMNAPFINLVGSSAPDLFASAVAHIEADPCIDLENFALGTVLTDQVNGLTVEVEANGRGVDEAMVFDTANPTGGDHDLFSTTRGHVLIISEDGDSSDPDDNATGGEITFTFASPVSITNLVALDTEDGGMMSAYDADGELIREEPIPQLPDGTEAVVDMTAEDVSEIVIDLQGSGAFDDFCFGVPVTNLALVQ